MAGESEATNSLNPNVVQINVDQSNVEKSNIEQSSVEQSNVEQTNVDQKPIEISNDQKPNVSEQVPNNISENGSNPDNDLKEDSKDLSPASAVHGGREISNKILYIGNLHKSLDEDKLIEIFGDFGSIKSAKVLNDKNKMGFNYAFLEFDEPDAASSALNKLNGETIHDYPIKINWAYHSSNANSVQSAQPVFNIFVGDLSPEVDDETLSNQFAQFNSLKEAHVMWDMQTSRSRGYGFVTFLHQNDADLALKTMNGKKILGRNIRCNWASHKQANFKKGRKMNLHLNNPNLMHPTQSGAFQTRSLHPAHQQLQPGPLQHIMQGHPPPLHMQGAAILGPHPPIQGSPMSQGNPGDLPNQTGNDGQIPGSSEPGAGSNLGPNANANPNSMPIPVQGLPGGSVNMPLRPPPSGQFLQPQLNEVSPGAQVPFPGNEQNFNNDLVTKFDDLELSQDNHHNNNNNNNANINNHNVGGPIPMMVPQSYEIVLRQTPSWQTTVYLGNIAHFSQQNDFLPLLQNLGFIVDFKFHPEKGCAFVKYDTHERAAMAIVQLAGFNINGRPLKCGWGKDKPPQYRNLPPMYNQRT